MVVPWWRSFHPKAPLLDSLAWRLFHLKGFQVFESKDFKKYFNHGKLQAHFSFGCPHTSTLDKPVKVTSHFNLSSQTKVDPVLGQTAKSHTPQASPALPILMVIRFGSSAPCSNGTSLAVAMGKRRSLQELPTKTRTKTLQWTGAEKITNTVSRVLILGHLAGDKAPSSASPAQQKT